MTLEYSAYPCLVAGSPDRDLVVARLRIAGADELNLPRYLRPYGDTRLKTFSLNRG